MPASLVWLANHPLNFYMISSLVLLMKEESHLESGTYRGYQVSVKLVRQGHEQYNRRKLSEPGDVYEFFKDIEDLDREVFYAAHLDAGNHVIACEEVSKGTLSATLVTPREVYKSAILSSAASIIVAHNHPSGETNPSREDLGIAERLYRAGDILGIPLIDSLIIGHGKYLSLHESGHLRRFFEGVVE